MTNQIIMALTLHFFADFVAQSDWMAINKSKRWAPLTIHVLVYSAFFILPFGWKFAAVNGAAHFITDAITSRVSSALWARQQRHWFFVVIGLDQLLHQVVLVLTIGKF